MMRTLAFFLALLFLAAPAIAEWDDSQPAAEFIGGVVTLGQLRKACADVQEIAGALTQETIQELLEALVEQAVIELKQREYGVYDLDADAQLRLRHEADSQYAIMAADYGADYLAAQGVSAEWIYDDLAAQLRQEALRDAVTSDITASDDDVRAGYESRAAAQETEFGLDPASYDMALMDGEMIFYNPPGYRRVQAILLAFDAEAQVEYDALAREMESAGDSVRIQELLAAMDGLYATPLRTAEKLIERLNAGEEFAGIQAAYSGDACGEYVVGPESAQYGDEFRDAAMALETVGDISGVVYSDWGVYILRYSGDVETGRVEFSEVEPLLRQAIETEARNAAYGAQVEKWLEEAEIVYYTDRF